MPPRRRLAPFDAAIARLQMWHPEVFTGKNVEKKRKLVQLTTLDIEVQRAESVLDDVMSSKTLAALRRSK